MQQFRWNTNIQLLECYILVVFLYLIIQSCNWCSLHVEISCAFSHPHYFWFLRIYWTLPRWILGSNIFNTTIFIVYNIKLFQTILTLFQTIRANILDLISGYFDQNPVSSQIILVERSFTCKSHLIQCLYLPYKILMMMPLHEIGTHP